MFLTDYHIPLSSKKCIIHVRIRPTSIHPVSNNNYNNPKQPITLTNESEMNISVSYFSYYYEINRNLLLKTICTE